MQREADAERDVVIPWPVVTGAFLFGGFLVTAALVAGRGEATLDAAIIGVRNGWSVLSVLDKPGGVALFLLNRLFNDVTLYIAISGIVLAMAFASDRRTAVLRVLTGPIAADAIQRKPQLLAGEILTGITAVAWLAHPLALWLNRHGPWWESVSFPDASIVGAFGFWASLAGIAWRMQWRSRHAATAAFAIAAALALASATYGGRDWPTDILGSVLLGCAILCVARATIDWALPRQALNG